MGEPAFLFLPTWEIVPSRAWKFQIPYFARHGRVVTFDRRGNGRSDRPVDVRAYDRQAAVGDALAVLDRVRAGCVVVVSWCGAGADLILPAGHAERVGGLVLTGRPAADRRSRRRGGPIPLSMRMIARYGACCW